MINKDTLSIEQRYRLIKMTEHLIREGKTQTEVNQILLEAGFNFGNIKQGLSNLAGNAIQGVKNAWNQQPAQQGQQQPAPAQQQAPAQGQQQAPAQGQQAGTCPTCGQPMSDQQAGQQAGQQKRILKPAAPGQVQPNPNLKFDNINATLQNLGLGKYAQNFSKNSVDDSIASNLTSEDLKNIGITSIGHRNQILQALQGQNTQAQPAQPAAQQAPAQQPAAQAAPAPKKRAPRKKA